MCPTNGAAASMEAFAAALGSGKQKRTSLVSPANTTPQTCKRLVGSNCLGENFLKKEKRRGRSTCVGRIYAI
jgi:hypothetical protein